MRIPLLAFVVLMASTAVIADKITKKDGTEIVGRILREEESTLYVEVDRNGTITTIPVVRSAVESIQRGPATRPTTAPATKPTASGGKTPEERRAEYLAKQQVEEERKAEAYAAAQRRRAAEREEAERRRAEYMDRIGPELTAIDDKLAQIRIRGRAAEDTLQDLDGQLGDELAAENRTYQAALDAALRERDPQLRSVLRARVENDHSTRMAFIRAGYRDRIANAELAINMLAREQQSLVAKRNSLMASVPRVPPG